MRVRLALLVVLAACGESHAAQFIVRRPVAATATLTCTATCTTCSATDVATLLTAATAGQTVCVSAGTYHWTTQMLPNAGNAIATNVTLAGAGSLSTVGGGDVTVIVDDDLVNEALVSIQLNATGALRVAGIDWAGGVGVAKDSGLISLHGPGSVRFDHVHLNQQAYTDPGARARPPLTIADHIYGVIDHSILDLYSVSAIIIVNGAGSDGVGNATWAADTAFGASTFFFIEDNQINSDIRSVASRTVDCFTAGRGVIRFNTLAGVSGPEMHATGHSSGDRGCRAFETYLNHFTVLAGLPAPAFVMDDASSGPALVWGNAADTEALKSFLNFNVTRKGNTTYNESMTPTQWGYCGGTVATGTVNVAVDGVSVTKTAGTNFNVSWLTGTMIDIVGASCTHVGQGAPTGTGCRVSSVASTTALTLQDTTGGTLVGKTYTVGSAWDGNTDLRGYPCIDQGGRGKGDLLTGSFPTKVNSTTGTIAWPNQALEPVYVWNNAGTPSSGYGGQVYSEDSDGRIVADRDYYAQASGVQTTASTPFTGTTGTGWGTLANRPTTCTTGVGYFATDQGSWNAGSNSFYTGQGLLYTCTAPNTWTLYYTPYTYPHPLVH